MQILTVSGSDRPTSSNSRLLRSIGSLLPEHKFSPFPVEQLPLYSVARDTSAWPEHVDNWRSAVQTADSLIISTPEYLHNMPAQLKNALEWLTTSGDLVGKKVLAITYTPAPPRGSKAMQSLQWSLTALDSVIVATLPLHQTEVQVTDDGLLTGEPEHIELLRSAIELLTE